jgi:hypothetical protein
MRIILGKKRGKEIVKIFLPVMREDAYGDERRGQW